MQKMTFISLFLVPGFILCLTHLPTVEGQLQNMPSSSQPVNASQVSVSTSLSVGVNNQTLDTKDRMLRNAVVGFLTSGPNVLKTTPTDQPIVKTKINNQVTNATQIVEGIEATNAIIGVELSKSLKSLVASATDLNQTNFVNVTTSSLCKSAELGPLGCENNVVIK